MFETLLIILGPPAFVFWIVQIVQVLSLDVSNFESHTHKLIWFLVVFSCSLIGAFWFFTWRRRQIEVWRGMN